MKQNIKFIPRLLAYCFLLSALISCKKTDQFYDTLNDLPQIDYWTHSYQSTYIVGDTMVITGKFQPVKNIGIAIGGIPANIIKTDSLIYMVYPPGGQAAIKTYKQQVSFLITSAMVGKGKEVNITLNGNSLTGSPVDIYSSGGPGSLTDSLKSVVISTFINNSNVFLNCINGKGDVYYYATTSKDLRHIKSDGSEEIVYDLSKSIDPTASVLITTFLAGGVDAQERYLYFSVSTSRGYRFCRLDLSTKQLSTLNQSVTLAAPYEGAIGSVNLIVTGIYPGAGNIVYLGIGTGTTINGLQVPDAVASYDITTAKVTYIYKQIARIDGATYSEMPGVSLRAIELGNVSSLRISPDENILYALEAGFAQDATTNIEVFDLQERIRIKQLITVNLRANSFNVINPFTALQINIGGGSAPDYAFGYLPMPGQRLQVLLYQFIASTSNTTQNIANQNGFPKWITFNFNEERTYTYAPGRFEQGNYIFQPTQRLSPKSTAIDQLLNYDAAGNLYMTVNGKMALIKTQMK